MQFTESVAASDFGSFGETVNVAPLIAAPGVLSGLANEAEARHTWTTKLENVKRFSEFLSTSRWRPELPHDSLRSGIALLRRAGRKKVNACDTGQIREMLTRHGIVASAFPSGVLRFSMPDFFLSGQHLALVCRALHQIA